MYSMRSLSVRLDFALCIPNRRGWSPRTPEYRGVLVTSDPNRVPARERIKDELRVYLTSRSGFGTIAYPELPIWSIVPVMEDTLDMVKSRPRVTRSSWRQPVRVTTKCGTEGLFGSIVRVAERVCCLLGNSPADRKLPPPPIAAFIYVKWFELYTRTKTSLCEQ
jgi:hypothetical protein